MSPGADRPNPTPTPTTTPAPAPTPAPAGATAPALAPAHVYAQSRNWPGYFAAVAGKPPRDTLLAALRNFEREGAAPALAVDLGCGEGRDAAELLRRGWNVAAIDGHPEAFARLLARDDLVHRDRLTTLLGALEEVRIPAARLVNASFSLPFCEPAAFAALWGRIRAAVEPGGRFAGQIFGDRDSWASIPDRTHHRRADLDGLFEGFLLEELREDETDSADAEGNPKHWHVFHIVARKMSPTVAE